MWSGALIRARTVLYYFWWRPDVTSVLRRAALRALTTDCLYCVHGERAPPRTEPPGVEQNSPAETVEQRCMCHIFQRRSARLAVLCTIFGSHKIELVSCFPRDTRRHFEANWISLQNRDNGARKAILPRQARETY
jgi:hypothetical protein